MTSVYSRLGPVTAEIIKLQTRLTQGFFFSRQFCRNLINNVKSQRDFLK